MLYLGEDYLIPLLYGRISRRKSLHKLIPNEISSITLSLSRTRARVYAIKPALKSTAKNRGRASHTSINKVLESLNQGYEIAVNIHSRLHKYGFYFRMPHDRAMYASVAELRRPRGGMGYAFASSQEEVAPACRAPFARARFDYGIRNSRARVYM